MNNDRNYVTISGGGNYPGSLETAATIVDHLSHDNEDGSVYMMEFGMSPLLRGDVKLVNLKAEQRESRRRLHEVIDAIVGGSRDYVGGENAPRAGQRLDQMIEKYKLDAGIVIGGNGTASGLLQTIEETRHRIPFVFGIKTIDGDTAGTEYNAGFKTAVDGIAARLGERGEDARRHGRVSIVQVPGRDSGWLAYHGGLAGKADITLIPEVRFSAERITQQVRRYFAEKGYCVVCVSEGFVPEDVERDDVFIADKHGNNAEPSIGKYLEAKLRESIGSDIAAQVEQTVRGDGKIRATTIDSEDLRGRKPNAHDIEYAQHLGVYVAELAKQAVSPEPIAVVRDGQSFREVPLSEIANKTKLIHPDIYDTANMRPDLRQPNLYKGTVVEGA